MIAAASADVVAAVIGAASGLLVVLLIWVLIHHSRPQLKVDVGVRGWVHLMRPHESPPVDEEEKNDPPTPGSA